MDNAQIHLDGDPRKLARAVYQAARASCREKHGRQAGRDDMKADVEARIPALAKQMAEALDSHARDVYLINALEVLALYYARNEFEQPPSRTE